MSKLYYEFGTMGSSKTANLLMVAHNYESQGKRVIVYKPGVDTRWEPEQITSRAVKGRAGRLIHTDMDMYKDVEQDISKKGELHCILVDEAQFLSALQVQQLADIVDYLDIPVMCYGLKNTYQDGVLFTGSAALLYYADTIEEIKTVCQYCNKKATMNLRIEGEKAVYRGSVEVVLGDTQEEKEGYYVPVCRKHYKEPRLTPLNNGGMEKDKLEKDKKKKDKKKKDKKKKDKKKKDKTQEECSVIAIECGSTHLEIERKYLIELQDVQSLVANYQMSCVEINQVYLKSEEPGVEKRIRQEIGEDTVKYTKAQKKEISDLVREEDEHEISEEEYTQLNAGEVLGRLNKRRYTLKTALHTLEIDVYAENRLPWGFAILEIELPTEETQVTLPAEIRVISEVTGKPVYKNSSLAVKALTMDEVCKEYKVKKD